MSGSPVDRATALRVKSIWPKDDKGRQIGFALFGGEASDQLASDELMAFTLPKPRVETRSEPECDGGSEAYG